MSRAVGLIGARGDVRASGSSSWSDLLTIEGTDYLLSTDMGLHHCELDNEELSVDLAAEAWPESVLDMVQSASVGIIAGSPMGLFVVSLSAVVVHVRRYAQMNRFVENDIFVLPTKVVQLAAGNSHVAALLLDGSVVTWGDGHHGQLGRDLGPGVADPQCIANWGGLQQPPIVSVGCTATATVMMTIQGTLYVTGQIGDVACSTPRAWRIRFAGRSGVDIAAMSTTMTRVMLLDCRGSVYVINAETHTAQTVLQPVLQHCVDAVLTDTHVVGISANGNFLCAEWVPPFAPPYQERPSAHAHARGHGPGQGSWLFSDIRQPQLAGVAAARLVATARCAMLIVMPDLPNLLEQHSTRIASSASDLQADAGFRHHQQHYRAPSGRKKTDATGGGGGGGGAAQLHVRAPSSRKRSSASVTGAAAAAAAAAQAQAQAQGGAGTTPRRRPSRRDNTSTSTHTHTHGQEHGGQPAAKRARRGNTSTVSVSGQAEASSSSASDADDYDIVGHIMDDDEAQGAYLDEHDSESELSSPINWRDDSSKHFRMQSSSKRVSSSNNATAKDTATNPNQNHHHHNNNNSNNNKSKNNDNSNDNSKGQRGDNGTGKDSRKDSSKMYSKSSSATSIAMPTPKTLFPPSSPWRRIAIIAAIGTGPGPVRLTWTPCSSTSMFVHPNPWSRSRRALHRRNWALNLLVFNPETSEFQTPLERNVLMNDAASVWYLASVFSNPQLLAMSFLQACCDESKCGKGCGRQFVVDLPTVRAFYSVVTTRRELSTTIKRGLEESIGKILRSMQLVAVTEPSLLDVGPAVNSVCVIMAHPDTDVQMLVAPLLVALITRLDVHGMKKLRCVLNQSYNVNMEWTRVVRILQRHLTHLIGTWPLRGPKTSEEIAALIEASGSDRDIASTSSNTNSNTLAGSSGECPNGCPDGMCAAVLEACEAIARVRATAMPVAGVDPTEFYNEALGSRSDLPYDYVRYVRSVSTASCSVFRWPFLLAPKAKAAILSVDTFLQRDAGLKKAMRTNMRAQMMQNNMMFRISVRRDHVVEDAFEQILDHLEDLRKPLMVTFVGEDGVDGGAIRKEFFQIVMRAMLDQEHGLFVYLPEERVFRIRTDKKDTEEKFELVGILFGLAVYNGVILDVYFGFPFFKLLMGNAVDLDDLCLVERRLGKSLLAILNWQQEPGGPPFEDVFPGLTFEVSIDSHTKTELVELIPHGAQTPVTAETRGEFVRLYTEYVMEKSTATEMQAIRQGWNLVIGGCPLIDMLEPFELEELVCGSPVLDKKEWQATCHYAGGFDESSPVVQWFWDLVHNGNETFGRTLLTFCTGSDRVPVSGLQSLKFTIQRNGPDADRLPTSQACFNVLLLPEYSSKEKLGRLLNLAITESAGFHLC